VVTFRGTATDETRRLREQLLLEVPTTTANYPDPVITPYTKYWYTYHNDTVEKITRITGLTYERLQELNPHFDFTQTIRPGAALLISSEQGETEERVVARTVTSSVTDVRTFFNWTFSGIQSQRN
jgi:LysM repeat protein